MENPESNNYLFHEFVSESDKKLLQIRKDIKLLHKNPKNLELVHSILRGFHNIKSSAFNLQLPNIRRVAHLSEDILVMLRDKKIPFDKNTENILHESIAYIDEVLINLFINGFEGRTSPVNLILKLKELIDGVAKKEK